LTACSRRATDDGGDRIEREPEHVVQDERGAFCGCQPIEHDCKCELDLVVEGDAVGGVDVGDLARDEAFDETFVSRVRGPKAVQAQPSHDDREPSAHVVDLVDRDVAESAECLLNDVFCSSGVAQRACRLHDQPSSIGAPAVIQPVVEGGCVVALLHHRAPRRDGSYLLSTTARPGM
jgi:hypothetical protein